MKMFFNIYNLRNTSKSGDIQYARTQRFANPLFFRLRWTNKDSLILQCINLILSAPVYLRVVEEPFPLFCSHSRQRDLHFSPVVGAIRISCSIATFLATFIWVFS